MSQTFLHSSFSHSVIKCETKLKNLLMIYQSYKLKILKINLGLDIFEVINIFETLFEYLFSRFVIYFLFI